MCRQQRIVRCDKNRIPQPLAKSGVDRLKECTNICGLQFTTKEEEDSMDPPRMGTKKDATPARVERNSKADAQVWRQTD